MVWVDKASKENFPVIIDYDFKKSRCRGISCRLDFFSYGALSNIIESFSEDEMNFVRKEGLFVRKDGLYFTEGFFLFDFNLIFEDLDAFIGKLKTFKTEEIYFENSKYHKMEGVVSRVNWCRAHLMELDYAENRAGKMQD